jgi:hypothetical protein
VHDFAKVIEAVRRRGPRWHIEIGLCRRIEIETDPIRAVRISMELRDKTVAIRSVVATQGYIRDGARKSGEDRLQASNELLE